MDRSSGIDLDDIRRRLEEERAALRASSDRSREDRKPVALDQQSVGRLSRMDAMQGQAMAMATERRRRVRLARVEAALERLEAGGFGDCVICGEPIEAKRLAFDPSTPTCLACAEQAG